MTIASTEAARQLIALAKQDAPRPESTSTRLVNLARDAGLDLFHDAEQSPFADIRIDGIRQTWAMKSGTVRNWLARLAHEQEGRVPGSQAVADALTVLCGRAQFDGSEQPVAVRVAGDNARLYIDLANAKWQAVRIDERGWRVVDEPPVRFRRPRAMRPLPDPVRGRSLDDLKQLVNVPLAQWPLLVAWLTAAFRDTGPYTLLVLAGEQGSAKSTTAKTLRQLIDPNCAPLRGQPRDPRDLAIAASNGWIVALDNLSWLPSDLSDALCRLSTGGGFATRQLYTDGEEVVFDFRRPALVTSIAEVIAAPDLLDRAILLDLQPVESSGRKTESTMEANFARLQPGILGAILDAVSGGLRLLPTIHQQHLPRMADFALWGEAVWRGLGNRPGEFMDAYRESIGQANAASLESSPVALAVLRFMEGRDLWEGSAAELLAALTKMVGEDAARKKNWPTTANLLSAALARAAPALRRAGVHFEREKGNRGRRAIRLTATRGEQAGNSSPSSPPSPPTSKNAGNQGVSGGDGPEEGSPPIATPSPPRDANSPQKTGVGGDGGDEGDDFPTLSGWPVGPLPDSLERLLARLVAAGFGALADSLTEDIRVRRGDRSAIDDAIDDARRVLGDVPEGERA